MERNIEKFGPQSSKLKLDNMFKANSDLFLLGENIYLYFKKKKKRDQLLTEQWKLFTILPWTGPQIQRFQI